jgi:hypothetical protein
MTPFAIEPADVYARVGILQATVVILAAMIFLQVVGKFMIFRRVMELLCQSEKQAERVERLLTYAEKHGSISDAQKERTERAVTVATTEVKTVVQGIPEKTAEKTVEKLKDMAAPDSGPHPKPPPVPPGPLCWLIAPAMILAAVLTSTAAVLNTSREGERMAAPANPTAAGLYGRAVGDQRAGRFADALEGFRAAAAAGYDPALSLFGVAECAFYLRDDGACREACGELMRADPGRARFWLGHLCRRAGDEAGARAEWEWSFKEGFALAGMVLSGSPHLREGRADG